MVIQASDNDWALALDVVRVVAREFLSQPMRDVCDEVGGSALSTL